MSVEDLIVYKVLAGRAKDISDVEHLLITHPSLDAKRVRRWTRALADLSDTPEMNDRLEALLSARRRR